MSWFGTRAGAAVRGGFPAGSGGATHTDTTGDAQESVEKRRAAALAAASRTCAAKRERERERERERREVGSAQ